jgi:FMN phosphatase YigB (HAD superfamily)
MKPEEILYVGDSIKLDMEPASATGMNAVLIDRLNAFPGYRGIRINSFAELKTVIYG